MTIAARLELIVDAEGTESEMRIGWDNEAPQKRLSIFICPAGFPPEDWQTLVCLTRQDAQILRDFLTSLLALPAEEKR